MNDDRTKLPFMRVWVRDFIADDVVQELNLEELGAYWKLLLLAWTRGSIPADPKRRARILGVSAAKERSIWNAIGSKWQQGPDGDLVNPRQERERAEAIALHTKRVEAGRKGGQARKEKRQARL